MLSDYDKITAQILADVTEALGISDMQFGARTVEPTRYPCGTAALQPMPRQDSGARSIGQVWEFIFEFRWPAGSTTRKDAERFKLGEMEKLILLLAPFITTTPPSPFPSLGLYAGVGGMRAVTDIDTFVKDLDENGYIAARLTFSCRNEVYQ